MAKAKTNSESASAIKGKKITGCCQINIPGGSPQYISNVTQKECAENAVVFPGATYIFKANQDCPAKS
jgi:hypothetical protein